MKIALDPYMHRHLSLEALCRATKEMGYDHIELSPRADFLQWWTRPRVYPERLQSFKKAMKEEPESDKSIEKKDADFAPEQPATKQESTPEQK